MSSVIVLSSKSLLLERNVEAGDHRILGNGKIHHVGFCSLPPLRSHCSFIELRKERRQSQARGVSRSMKGASKSRIAEAVSPTGECLKDDEIVGEVVLQNVGFLSVTKLPLVKPWFYFGKFFDLLTERKVSVELVSRDQVDPETGLGKTSGHSDLKWTPGIITIETHCRTTFKWNSALGIPGALRIKNMHGSEFFLKSLTISIPGEGEVHFPCNSWIFPASLQSTDRVFFANKSFLPEETPVGLKKARQLDLEQLRGDGSGERKLHDLIYAYDVYNDLGYPDEDPEPPRKVLGGSQDFPYPRRCRTGRPRIEKAPKFETRTTSIYIPPDERLPYADFTDFEVHLLLADANLIFPKLVYRYYRLFKSFEDINWLYEEEPKSADDSGSPFHQTNNRIRDFFTGIRNAWHDMRLLKFVRPQIIRAHEGVWRSDEEFARQTLAGINPIVIECLQKFPPSSSLDKNMYGPQESAITAQHIENNLESLSVKQAIEGKRLFIVDYYDAYMPYVERINKLPNGAKIYASRTVYFLTKEGTLKPVAIELCLPAPVYENKDVRRVFTPGKDGREEEAVWQLAKTHVKVNDAGYHQLVSHLLRTHCIMEPFIIATHRQLSKMHPLYKLLIPHYLGTMDINQAARQSLINASGIIEENFAPGRYSMEISSKAYKQWKFNEQGLEADLLKRGMAVRDANVPNGLKLVIEDYPYAVDGIEIWFALKEWISDYMAIYYKDDASVKEDKELQDWWFEIVNEGHEDIKDDPSRWYKMESLDEAIQIITTIIWTASAHHAAVNFGQYSYGGYMPNLPTFSRRLIPDKGTPEYAELLRNPNEFLIETLPTPNKALAVMTILQVLSNHSKSEVYLGQLQGSTIDRVNDSGVEEAFKKFQGNMKKVEEKIEERNGKPRVYKNRSGPAEVPYTLLFPSTSDETRSGGLTGRGVPNSISI